jgi:hypothetical protein
MGTSLVTGTMAASDTAPLTFVTGGAVGADFAWIRALSKHGTWEVHSFAGHKHVPLPDEWLRRMSPSDVPDANEALKTAARALGKRLPESDSYTHNLLRRNYAIAKDVNALFAIACLEEDEQNRHAIGVQGGTGWTCQLFAQLHAQCGPLSLYVCDRGTWHQCTRTADLRFVWTKCGCPLISNTGRFGFIGTRNMTMTEEQAICKFVNTNWPSAAQ